MPQPHLRSRRLLLAMALLAAGAGGVDAQQTHPGNGRHYVYDQYVPPGVAGHMSVMSGTVRPFVPQQVRIHLPEEGKVTYYDGAVNRPVSVAAPSQAAMVVGAMYRIKLSDMVRFPHTEFFPSIELIDELHPPPGQAERFPIEIELLEEELALAARGRMVTKVVYLEQPDRVPLANLRDTPRVIDVAPGGNAIAEADALGRPIAIVRLGGRLPDPHAPDVQFWGSLAPIQLTLNRIPETPQGVPAEGAAAQAPALRRPELTVFPAATPAPSPSLR